MGRLGDLRECETPGGTFSNFAQEEKIFGAAAQRLAVLTTELPDDSIEAFEAKDTQGSKVQVIVEKGYHGPPPTESIRHLFRVVSSLPMAATISESAACIFFPARGGQMDYAACLRDCTLRPLGFRRHGLALERGRVSPVVPAIVGSPHTRFYVDILERPYRGIRTDFPWLGTSRPRRNLRKDSPSAVGKSSTDCPMYSTSWRARSPSYR